MSDKQEHTYHFNPNDHVMQIKNKGGSADYLAVMWRLVWFNEQCPEGKITIIEKVVDPDCEVEKDIFVWNSETRRSEKVHKTGRGYAWFLVRAEDGKGKVGEAFGSETALDFEDWAEKADTKATGRALAKIGYGTQFAIELDEGARIVDAPVDRSSSSSDNSSARKPIVSVPPTLDQEDRSLGGPAEAKDPTTAATDQQLSSIRKLCQSLGKPEPEELDQATYGLARELIRTLSIEYRQSRKAS